VVGWWLQHTAIGCGRQPEDGSVGPRVGEAGEKREREKGESRGGWLVGQPAGWGPADSGGMTGGPEPGKEKKEKENRINSNLKLTLQIYSNLIRSKQDLPKLGKLK
jgi:hypothetical protein